MGFDVLEILIILKKLFPSEHAFQAQDTVGV